MKAPLAVLAAALFLLIGQSACTATCDPPRHMVSYQTLDGFPNYRCVGPTPGPASS